MKTPTTLALLAALVAGGAAFGGTPALAGHGHDPSCPATTEGPRLKASEIVRKAEDAGFEVIEFEAKHGCWEIEALGRLPAALRHRLRRRRPPDLARARLTAVAPHAMRARAAARGPVGLVLPFTSRAGASAGPRASWAAQTYFMSMYLRQSTPAGTSPVTATWSMNVCMFSTFSNPPSGLIWAISSW